MEVYVTLKSKITISRQLYHAGEFARIRSDSSVEEIALKGNILHTGDRHLHRPCHHSDQQMQVPVQSS